MLKEILAKNWPTWSAALLVVAIFVAQNRGIVTAEQVQTILAILGIGGVAGAPPRESRGSQGSVVRRRRLRDWFQVFALPLAFCGCSSFLHFQDPSVDDFLGRLCAGKAEEARPALEQEAQKTGVPLGDLLTAFETACLFRAKAGVSESADAGMAGAARAGGEKLTPENAVLESRQ